MGEKSTSPWVWIGCGCAGIVFLGILAVGGMAFVGVRTARTMTDPDLRHAKALELLKASRLPDGYETEIAMSVPMFAKFVILQGMDGQFIYMDGLRSRGDLRKAYESDEDFDDEVRRAGLKVGRRHELLARDAVQLGAADVRYALYAGEVSFDASGATGRANFDFDDEGIDADLSAVLLLRCSEDDRPALAIWAGPSIGDDREAAGPTGDQQALVTLLEQFGFCSG